MECNVQRVWHTGDKRGNVSFLGRGTRVVRGGGVVNSTDLPHICTSLFLKGEPCLYLQARRRGWSAISIAWHIGGDLKLVQSKKRSSCPYQPTMSLCEVEHDWSMCWFRGGESPPDLSAHKQLYISSLQPAVWTLQLSALHTFACQVDFHEYWPAGLCGRCAPFNVQNKQC